MATPTDVSLALRPHEAARALGISPRLLWQLTKEGRIPCVRINQTAKRQTVRYPVAALQAWLSQQTTTVEPPGKEVPHDYPERS
ncbi:MAG: helix-turn-helix transcriptional regulator [Bryobacteraceae bacterium]